MSALLGCRWGVMGTGAAGAYLANLGKAQRYLRDVYEKLSVLSVRRAESQ